MKPETGSAAMRIFMVRIAATGGYIPGDPIKWNRDVVNGCIRRGWITVERDGACLLTAKGRADFAWGMTL